MKVSVIVCTRNRADSLARCLASIAADRSVTPSELIVVDNGSSDHTASVLDRFATTLPLLVVHERREGSSRARNAGVAAASGTIVLFADDDVTVEDGWTDRLVEPFADPVVGAAGGRVVPVFETEPEAWMLGPHLEQAALRDYGEADRHLVGHEMPFGANMAVRHSLLGTEPFHPRLGHTGGGTMGWEEWHLLMGLDCTIAYAARAVVKHHVMPGRLTWNVMRRNQFLGGMGHARHQRIRGDPLPSLGRRFARCIRVAHQARRARAHNQSADEAWREFGAYRQFGQHVEMLIGGIPAMSDAVARLALH